MLQTLLVCLDYKLRYGKGSIRYISGNNYLTVWFTRGALCIVDACLDYGYPYYGQLVC